MPEKHYEISSREDQNITIGCEHSRPVGQTCPHCLGLNDIKMLTELEMLLNDNILMPKMYSFTEVRKILKEYKAEQDTLRKKEKCATAEAVARDTKFMIRKKIEGYFEHRILLDTPEEERDNIIKLIK